MEKYNGNQKGFIYASFDVKDQDEVPAKYLEPLTKDGISFWWADGFGGKEEKTLARAGALLLFLTKDYARDDRLRKTVEAAVRNDKPILTVYLEDVELDAGLSMQLESQQALFRSKSKSDEEFAEELKKAAIFDKIEVTEQQKKKQKSKSIIAIAAALVAVLVLALVIRSMLGSGGGNEDTMEALGLAGLSKSELESITSLHIVGDQLVDSSAGFYNTHYVDGDTGQVMYFDTDLREKTVAPGTISDLSGLEQLTNIRSLMLEGEQIEDASPLFGLEKCHTLSLNCNPIASLDGIENMSGLQYLAISDTNVSELPDGLHVKTLYAKDSKLTKVPDFGGLKDVEFDAGGADLQDYSNLGTAGNYSRLAINVREGRTGEVLDSLSGMRVGNLAASDLQIDSPKELSGVDVRAKMHIQNSSLTSLDGIEKFSELREINLAGCSGLRDLSPLNGLSSLETVIISDDMEGLASAVDERIHVEIAAGDTAGELRGQIEDYLSENWDGGYGVEAGAGSNKISVTIWNDSGNVRSLEDIDNWEEVVAETQRHAQAITEMMEQNSGATHLEMRYVVLDDSDNETELLVIKDGGITKNAGE